jgi:hypothetical protein
MQELLDRLILQDPLSLCKEVFGFTPNKQQARFLRDIQNPEMPEYMLQAPRGGGKTIICAAAVLWASLNIPQFKALILSGSFFQARRFYKHVIDFIALSPKLQEHVKGDPMLSLTEFKDGGVIHCLKASETQSRSPHVDWLFIDEFVIVKPNIIYSALPTVDTSEMPKKIYLSTASQTKGVKSLDLWCDWWDHAEDYETETYEWTAEDCSWIHKGEVERARKKLDPILFETEYLGKRAERVGAVFKTAQIEHAVKSAVAFDYDPELPTIGGIDWGVVHPTVCVIIQPQGEYNVVVDVWAESGMDVSWWCVDTLPLLQQKYKVKAWYCDAGGKPFNTQLENADQPVVIVPFNRYKDQMIGELRRELEYKLWKCPAQFETTIKQHKYYTYDEKGKPIKQNDDHVDANMLACWGASGEGLDKFELFALESEQREATYSRKRKKREWWREI